LVGFYQGFESLKVKKGKSFDVFKFNKTFTLLPFFTFPL